ncbi:carboxypeptidase B-like [Dreissena polymorpha]|uniref:Peptidase M14 domain-containing protein n=1 Tax=Dreissena polymorpha TaxID=45954 RepID=A0A9D4CER6_DREPO|nr:carboxypeptidase B-like [Dreissena polymorpha]KAH3722332.1 hypothetical protein DPMN_065290 [Dreissena polymorpha]
MRRGLACIALLGLLAFVSTHGPLAGLSVVRVVPETKLKLTLLQRLLAQRQSLDIWKEPACVSCAVDIRLTPLESDDVTSALKEHGFKPTILIDDVQLLLDYQRNQLFKRRSAEFDYGQYHTLDEINDWILNKTNVYKSLTLLFNITKSYEGRMMTGLKISTPSQFTKPAFFIMGGIHAREWISPATAIYMFGQMLDRYKIDSDITKMVDMFDWYLLPITNPDGYAFTWTGDQNRLWRKTRSKHGLCYGVDPNRNWDIQWCETEGASKDPCSETYCGPSAFSEVEVKGVAAFLQGIKGLKGFIDVHSYSQLWMSPWGYTRNLSKDFQQQDAASAAATDALHKVYGTKYAHGSIANTIYIASGTSTDWAYGKIDVKYAFGVELRDTEKYGCLLPEDQIIPSGIETLQGLMALASYVKDN